MKPFLLIMLMILSLATCNEQDPNELKPEVKTYAHIYQTGYATWYGPGFHGGITASGERYDMYEYSAAHRRLPLGAIVKVYNTKNDKCVIVKINDRGPVKKSLIIDLSKISAIQLEMTHRGSTKVKLEVLSKSHNPLKKVFEVYAKLGNCLKS